LEMCKRILRDCPQHLQLTGMLEAEVLIGELAAKQETDGRKSSCQSQVELQHAAWPNRDRLRIVRVLLCVSASCRLTFSP